MTTRKKHINQRALNELKKITGKGLTLGSMLCAIRQGEEVSQADFAKKLGVSRQYLCDIEHDRRIVAPKSAAMYAKRLGYSSEQFVRLCLQDMVDRDGVNVIIGVKAA